MGNVLSAGLGQAPANSAARLAGLPASIPASAVNKVCASGMKAIMSGANAIAAGQADIVVAGGMESMSRAPFLLPLACRTGGLRFGEQALIDSVQWDGLTDAETSMLMGLCGEKCAEDHGISRADSDAYAMRSYERAIGSRNSIARDIVSLTVTQGRDRSTVVVDQDEGLKSVGAISECHETDCGGGLLLSSIIRTRCCGSRRSSRSWELSRPPMPAP